MNIHQNAPLWLRLAVVALAVSDAHSAGVEE
jgi:hypothetical protein